MVFRAQADLVGRAMSCTDEKDCENFSQVCFHFVQLDIISHQIEKEECVFVAW